MCDSVCWKLSSFLSWSGPASPHPVSSIYLVMKLPMRPQTSLDFQTCLLGADGGEHICMAGDTWTCLSCKPKTLPRRSRNSKMNWKRRSLLSKVKAKMLNQFNKLIPNHIFPPGGKSWVRSRLTRHQGFSSGVALPVPPVSMQLDLGFFSSNQKKQKK